MSNALPRAGTVDDLGYDYDRLLSNYVYSQYAEVPIDTIRNICQKIFTMLPSSHSATLATRVKDGILRNEDDSIREVIAELIVDIRYSLKSDGIPLAYPENLFDRADALEAYVQSRIQSVQRTQQKYRKNAPPLDHNRRQEFESDSLKESLQWVESMLAFGVLCQEKIDTATDDAHKTTALAYAKSWIERLKRLYTEATIPMIHEDHSFTELESSKRLIALMKQCSFPRKKESS